MNASSASSATVLSIPGTAADHLYREGSAKASFWEVLFGSRLAAEKRTKVSSLSDGTRRFDVPVAAVEHTLLANAHQWFAAQADTASTREARAALDAKTVRFELTGLQPRGTGVATFHLRLQMDGGAVSQNLTDAFTDWFAAERPRIEAVLVPFGFTPSHQ